MKKTIVAIVAIVATAVILNAQNSSSRPADQADSKTAASAPTSAATTIDPNAKYKIAMKYQPGVTYEIRLTETTETSPANDPASKKSTIRKATYYIQGSETDNEGNTKLSIIITRMQFKMPAMNGMAKGTEFDTDNPDGSEMGMLFKMLTNKTFQITLDKDWKITNIDEVEDGADNSQAKSDKQKPKLGADEIKQMVRPFILFPIDYANNYEIQAGKERIGNDAQLTNFGRARVKGDEKLTYKLTEIANSPAGKIATIDIVGNLSFREVTLDRNGQIKFNLTKNFTEHIKSEASGIIEGDTMKYLNKAEAEIKLVDKIPELKSASRPASQATSQASK